MPLASREGNRAVEASARAVFCTFRQNLAGLSFLIQNPKEWKLCDFSKLSGGDWVRLIRMKRWFYVLCNWELFTMDDWCDLLTSCPQFAKLFEMA